MKKHRKCTRSFVSWALLLVFVFSMVLCPVHVVVGAYTYPFQDPAQPLETRVSDLLSRLTSDEKISLLHQYQPAISRLGIPAFRTGTEALHGIAWLGTATVFPQAIGLGATFDSDLIKQIGSAVGDEARGFNKKDPVNNGLSLWAPVVDLERDPRAGRFEEGYGEDPYLVGQMSTAYCSGIKGDDPFYYKAIPTLKHFYAYNQEASRDTISVSIDARNKYEYYLKSFQYAIAGGAAKSMMTAYNLVNGVPCTVAPEINSLVKAKWASDFFVVTDAASPSNLVNSQHYYSDMPHALAGAIKAGVDSMTDNGSNSSTTINNIKTALSSGYITQTDIDNAVKNILRVRFHLGDFDGTVTSPYASLGTSEIGAADHAALSLKAARESVVMLKNGNNILPLSKSSSVAVIGPRANDVLTDFYSGTLPYKYSILDGVKKKVSTVTYAADNTNSAAVNAAKASNVAVVCVGNDPLCGNIGWGVSQYPSEGKEAVDRQTITLEQKDQDLIKAVYAANPNTIVVLVSSFPYAINWENTNVPGIVYTCHSGQELGTAVSDVLFGDYAPAGRLTSTWYSSTSQIPAINNYDIINGKRTYMYFDGTPLYPFGYGLTYTTFNYSNLRLSSSSISSTGQVTVSVDVQNAGTRTSDEVVQMYVKDTVASVKRPIKELKGFKRINLGAGQSQTVSFTLPASELAYWDTTRNDYYVEPGDFDIMVGKSSADIQLTTTLNVTAGTATATPSPSPTPTPSAATATPTPTPSVATATPTPTPSTATPTATPSTATPTPTPSTATPTPTPSTATPTPTPSTATPTATPSTATPTPTPSTATATPTPTPTAGTPSPGGIKVQFFNGNTAASTNTIYPNFKVVNTGTATINLSDIKMRYYFTNDGTQADSFACDYSTAGSGNITSSFTTIAKTNADRYLEVGFTTSAGTLAAGASAEVKGRVWKSDWSNFTQTNDYSFNSTATNYVDSTTVTGFIAGTLKWGAEP